MIRAVGNVKRNRRVEFLGDVLESIQSDVYHCVNQESGNAKYAAGSRQRKERHESIKILC